jgi:hypothetical protein
MADAGPRQMVDQRAQLFVRQERHGLDAGLDAELAIGIEKVLHPRIFDDRKVMDDVTDQEQRVVARRDHETGVSQRVTGRMLRQDAGFFFAASEEPSAGVPMRLSSVQ